MACKGMRYAEAMRPPSWWPVPPPVAVSERRPCWRNSVVAEGERAQRYFMGMTMVQHLREDGAFRVANELAQRVEAEYGRG